MKISLPPSSALSMQKCQRTLAGVWLLASFALVLMVFAQTAGSRYSDPSRAWGWLWPLLVPTLSAIVGGLTHTALNKDDTYLANNGVYGVALAASIGYLLFILVTLFAVGAKASTGAEAWLDQSKLWLVPLQGIVAAVNGFFFTSSRPADAPKA